mmetsp:Transcript_32772/g.75447  ORF Transcript_32772/g.75447 Transcript_32772/m.75447 type:complete len:141 (+) Transcript_32772:34-456(+)
MQAQQKQHARIPVSSRRMSSKPDSIVSFSVSSPPSPQTPVSKSWRCEGDDTQLEHRKITLLKINHFLRQRKDNSQEWRKEIPRLAKRLERCLYCDASSLEEYADDRTLVRRMKKLTIKTLRRSRLEQHITHSRGSQCRSR